MLIKRLLASLIVVFALHTCVVAAAPATIKLKKSIKVENNTTGIGNKPLQPIGEHDINSKRMVIGKKNMNLQKPISAKPQIMRQNGVIKQQFGKPARLPYRNKLTSPAIKNTYGKNGM